MFGLNQTATHYRRTGQQNGKPAYAASGEEFACRTQPIYSRTADNRGVTLDANVRVFAPASAAELGIETGDRLAVENENMIVAEVQVMRGFTRIHHLEILAKKER